MTTATETIATVISDMADYIETYGWRQGPLYVSGPDDRSFHPEYTSPASIESALFIIAESAKWPDEGDSKLYTEVTNMLTRQASLKTGIAITRKSSFTMLAAYNNDPSRTKQEIIDFLREAARAA